MNIKDHKQRQDDRAADLAEALGDFNETDAAYRAAMCGWNESNAKEGSQRWKQLEAAVDEAAKPRHAAALGLLRTIEQLAGIQYDVVARQG